MVNKTPELLSSKFYSSLILVSIIKNPVDFAEVENIFKEASSKQMLDIEVLKEYIKMLIRNGKIQDATKFYELAQQYGLANNPEISEQIKISK